MNYSSKFHPMYYCRPRLRHGLAVVTAVLSALVGHAQPAATGGIVGRVLNETSGSYLNNARVVVAGTPLEAFTNDSGEYQRAAAPTK